MAPADVISVLAKEQIHRTKYVESRPIGGESTAKRLAPALHAVSGVRFRSFAEVMMGRVAAWSLGTGFALVLLTAPANAQVHVDVGVIAPQVVARVVIGAPRVYVADRYDEPVYGPYDRPRGRGYGRTRAKNEREYDKDIREARREYEKDRREAEREYWKDRREAEREYWKDVREAEREREKDRREARRDRRW